MTRIAHCCCGSLRAEATGEPAFVAACHCMECQRRTGSPFGVSTYFPKEQVCTEGPSKVYVRGSDAGRVMRDFMGSLKPARLRPAVSNATRVVNNGTWISTRDPQ
jgi:glutathione-dependent formaldehyde-activating enzyme